MPRVITSPCACKLWHKIGADTDNIPEAVFGGIHWYTSLPQAVEKWKSLRTLHVLCRGSLTTMIPYYWAVHLNGEHINNVLDDTDD